MRHAYAFPHHRGQRLVHQRCDRTLEAIRLDASHARGEQIDREFEMGEAVPHQADALFPVRREGRQRQRRLGAGKFIAPGPQRRTWIGEPALAG